jgi:hypothetical protein
VGRVAVSGGLDVALPVQGAPPNGDMFLPKHRWQRPRSAVPEAALRSVGSPTSMRNP